jgi:hypothetical protein
MLSAEKDSLGVLGIEGFEKMVVCEQDLRSWCR